VQQPAAVVVARERILEDAVVHVPVRSDGR
jgi:hypothetical protein